MTQKHKEEIMAQMSTISANIAKRIANDNEIAIFQKSYHSPERLANAKRELSFIVSDRANYVKYKLVSWAIRDRFFSPDGGHTPDAGESDEEQEARLVIESRALSGIFLRGAAGGECEDKDSHAKREALVKSCYEAYVQRLDKLAGSELVRHRALMNQLLLKKKVPGYSALPDRLKTLAEYLEYDDAKQAQFLSYTDPLYSRFGTSPPSQEALEVYQAVAIRLSDSEVKQRLFGSIQDTIMHIKKNPLQLEPNRAETLAETLCTSLFPAGTNSADIGQGDGRQQRKEVRDAIAKKLMGKSPIQKNDVLILMFALLARSWDERRQAINSQRRLEMLLMFSKYLLNRACLPGFKATEKLERAMLISIQSDFYFKLSMSFLLNS